MKFTTEPNFETPDDFYACLLQAHESLNDDQSAQFNARLVLILANQIGKQDVLAACLEAANLNSGQAKSP